MYFGTSIGDMKDRIDDIAAQHPVVNFDVGYDDGRHLRSRQRDLEWHWPLMGERRVCLSPQTGSHGFDKGDPMDSGPRLEIGGQPAGRERRYARVFFDAGRAAQLDSRPPGAGSRRRDICRFSKL